MPFRGSAIFSHFQQWQLTVRVRVMVSRLVVAVSRTIHCNDHEWWLSEWWTLSEWRTGTHYEGHQVKISQVNFSGDPEKSYLTGGLHWGLEHWVFEAVILYVVACCTWLVIVLFGRYDGSQGQSFVVSDTHVPTTLQGCHWRHRVEPEACKLVLFYVNELWGTCVLGYYRWLKLKVCVVCFLFLFNCPSFEVNPGQVGLHGDCCCVWFSVVVAGKSAFQVSCHWAPDFVYSTCPSLLFAIVAHHYCWCRR